MATTVIIYDLNQPKMNSIHNFPSKCFSFSFILDSCSSPLPHSPLPLFFCLKCAMNWTAIKMVAMAVGKNCKLLSFFIAKIYLLYLINMFFHQKTICFQLFYYLKASLFSKEKCLDCLRGMLIVLNNILELVEVKL